MRIPSLPKRFVVAAALAAATVGGGLSSSASGATTPYAGPTPDASCDSGSLPEREQGRAPASDVPSHRSALGYGCNATQVSHSGATGGYRVERYVDRAGHECGYYDSTLLYPQNLADQGVEGPGTYVMDMHDPAHPVHTDTLRSPAMQSPHESVRLNVKRGLLVADMGYPTANPGFVDVWDVSANCLHPTLRASSPLGVLGHESGFSPDGNTFYVSSLYGHTLAAVDLRNPSLPTLAWFTYAYQPHGMSVSADGNRLYMADNGSAPGLTVLDVSQVQNRVPNPSVPVVSHLTWPQVSTPQNATPFTRGGHRYLLETDEFGSGASIGAARIIDIQDEKQPFVVSNMRLTVNQASAQGPDLEADPGQRPALPGLPGPLLLAAQPRRPDDHRLQLHHVRPEGVQHQRPGAPSRGRVLQQAAPEGREHRPGEGRLVRDVGAGVRREDARHLVLRREQRLLRRTAHQGRRRHQLRPPGRAAGQLRLRLHAGGRDAQQSLPGEVLGRQRPGGRRLTLLRDQLVVRNLRGPFELSQRHCVPATTVHDHSMRAHVLGVESRENVAHALRRVPSSAMPVTR